MLKKLITLLFVPFLGAACALTDYPTITDEDQLTKVVGTHVVNTNGEAYIKQKFQIAIVKPGGKTLETVWFADQNAAGDKTIVTRMNVGDISDFSTIFQGTVYLNTDSQGCWNVKASDPASEPFPSFDFTSNASCANGIGEGIFLRLAKGTRNMEAGKDPNAGTSTAGASSTSLRAQSAFGLSLQQFFSVANQLDGIAQYGDWRASYGLEGYKLTATPSNLTLELTTSAGVKTQIVVDGVVAVGDLRNGHAIIDARTGNMASVLTQVADWVDANGKSATLYATFAGTTGSTDVALFDSKVYRDAANSLK